jgi:hypothetical protein
MASKGRKKHKIKMASAEAAEPSGALARAALVVGPALLAVGLLAPIACGARDAGDLSYLSGGDGGAGTSGGPGPAVGSSGPGPSSSGAGGSGAGGAGTGGAGTGSGGATTGTGTGTGGASSSSTGGPPVLVTVMVLSQGSAYLYWDKGSVASNWADPGFDASGWSKGTAPLGYGDPHIMTDVSFGPSPASKYITTWFRTTFNVQNAASVIAVTLNLMRDDGALAFLNGVEVARSNLPDGPITANTEAPEIIQGADETAFIPFKVDPALLVEGPNWLAIEVHQAVANSSDLGIDATVTVEQLVP